MMRLKHLASTRNGGLRGWLTLTAAVALLASTNPAAADESATNESAANESAANESAATEEEGTKGLFGRPVDRSGFHFHVSFGIGGGPNTLGLFHAMEIGGTFNNGWTLALLHTFVQNKGIFGQHGGPDLIGGWMPQLKIPVFFPELVVKFATGFAGLHDQSDGIKVIGGWGAAYGVDFHFPFFATSGATVGLTMMNVVAQGEHFFAAGLGLGYTWF